VGQRQTSYGCEVAARAAAEAAAAAAARDCRPLVRHPCGRWHALGAPTEGCLLETRGLRERRRPARRTGSPRFGIAQRGPFSLTGRLRPSLSLAARIIERWLQTRPRPHTSSRDAEQFPPSSQLRLCALAHLAFLLAALALVLGCRQHGLPACRRRFAVEGRICVCPSLHIMRQQVHQPTPSFPHQPPRAGTGLSCPLRARTRSRYLYLHCPFASLRSAAGRAQGA